MLSYSGDRVSFVPDTGRRITVYRGQKTWSHGLVIEASSLRRSSGSRREQQNWTEALLTQFRRNLAGAMGGDQSSKKRFEALLLNAQQFAFQNPFVSCSFSYAVARSFGNANDTLGYVLTLEGPWYSGVDFEFLRGLFGLYGDAFDYLQEFGIPWTLGPYFALAKVERADDSWSPPVRVYPSNSVVHAVGW